MKDSSVWATEETEVRKVTAMRPVTLMTFKCPQRIFDQWP